MHQHRTTRNRPPSPKYFIEGKFYSLDDILKMAGGRFTSTQMRGRIRRARSSPEGLTFEQILR